MEPAVLESDSHHFEKPFPNKNLEKCTHCGIWRINSADLVVYLPPPEDLSGARLIKKSSPSMGRLLHFRQGIA